jgi:hypothetical protein
MATRRKHPPIKGKGSDVFLDDLTPQEGTDAPAPEPADQSAQRRPQAKEEKRVMVTFYLPPALVDKLDRTWVEQRLKNRKVQKSHIVTEALEAYLKDQP